MLQPSLISVTNRKLGCSFPSSTELTIHHIATRMNQALRAHCYSNYMEQCSSLTWRSARFALALQLQLSRKGYLEPPKPALANAIRIETLDQLAAEELDLMCSRLSFCAPSHWRTSTRTAGGRKLLINAVFLTRCRANQLTAGSWTS